MVRLVGRPPSEALARSAVQLIVHHLDLRLRHGAEVAALREVLAQRAVGVLVGPALPGVVGQAEVALRADGLGEQRVLGELLAPVERDGLAGPAAHRGHHRLPDRALPLRRRLPAGQEARGAVDHGDGARAARAPRDGVALPVARSRAPVGLGRALRDLVRYLDPAPPLGAVPAPAAPAAAPEPGGRPAAPYAAVEPARGDLAVDRGVADGEVGALEEDPALELLGRPSPLEDARPDELEPLGVVEQPGPAAPLPARLVAALRGRGPVEALARVAPQLPRHRRLVPADLARYLADAAPLAAHAHDVLALPDGKMLAPAHGRLLMMLSSQAPSYQGAVGRPSSGPLHLK